MIDILNSINKLCIWLLFLQKVAVQFKNTEKMLYVGNDIKPPCTRALPNQYLIEVEEQPRQSKEPCCKRSIDPLIDQILCTSIHV